MWNQVSWIAFLGLLISRHGVKGTYCLDGSDCDKYPDLQCCQEYDYDYDDNDNEQCGVIGGSRIYGGRPVQKGDLPWMAVIYYDRRKDPHCGATVISRRFLLTAAHCVTGEIVKKIGQPWYARLGVQNLSVESRPEDIYSFNRVIAHPEYVEGSGNRGSDIGLLKVDREIYYHESVRPVCLPAAKESVKIGTVLTVAGWGKTPFAYYNDQKLKTTLRVLPKSVCNKAYEKSKLNLGPGQLCTGGSGGSDTCRGDSGNGLYEERQGIYYIQGIVSFGASACGNEKWPSISTKVPWFIDWIQKHDSTY